MGLQEHYDKLWNSSIYDFRKGNFETDALLDSPADTRYGLTVVLRPDQEVKEAIGSMLLELERLEPRQYYYPPSDMHLTVMSVISCAPGFMLESIKPEEYVQVVGQVMQETPAFKIHFKGITASASCVLVQGFPDSETLQEMRARLRKAFGQSTLYTNIDARYTLTTAHSTVVRFRVPSEQPAAFLELLEKHRTHDFGTATIRQAELVANDWYQREKQVKLLGVFGFGC